jgi:hypothetical protein
LVKAATSFLLVLVLVLVIESQKFEDEEEDEEDFFLHGIRRQRIFPAFTCGENGVVI